MTRPHGRASLAGPRGAKVEFVAGFGPIVRDRETSRHLYAGVLGIAFREMDGGYAHTEALPGAKSFALWPLAQAARSCFGSDRWPENRAVPQAWLEFDVEDVGAATEALRREGYELLVAARKEPWGQTVSRLLSPEGLLVGVTYTPWMRSKPRPRPARHGAGTKRTARAGRAPRPARTRPERSR